MSQDNDPAYYERRERRARELAASAVDPKIKAVHLDMADRYAKLQDAGTPPRLTH